MVEVGPQHRSPAVEKILTFSFFRRSDIHSRGTFVVMNINLQQLQQFLRSSEDKVVGDCTHYHCLQQRQQVK